MTKEPRSINAIAIRKDATEVTRTGFSSWEDAAREALRWTNDPFYSDKKRPIVKVFISDGYELHEYLKEELAEKVTKALRG
jgi:hypothetical protein